MRLWGMRIRQARVSGRQLDLRGSIALSPQGVDLSCQEARGQTSSWQLHHVAPINEIESATWPVG